MTIQRWRLSYAYFNSISLAPASDRPRAEAALRAFYPDVIGPPSPDYFFWFDSPERAGWAVKLLGSAHDRLDMSFVERKSNHPEGRVFIESLRAELCEKAGLDWAQLTKVAGRWRTQQTSWHKQRLALRGLTDLFLSAALKTHPRHSEFQQKVRPLFADPEKNDAVHRVEDRFQAALHAPCGIGISLSRNLQSPYTFAKMAQDEEWVRSSGCEVVPQSIAAGWDLAQSAGLCWVFEGAVVLLERPAELRFDSELLLHGDDGPAGAFRDGTKIWAWHGIVTSEQFILHPEDIRRDAWRRWRKELPADFVARIEERRVAAIQAAPPSKPMIVMPAPAIVDAGKLLTRYQAGEREAVWKDLLALGPDVRKPPYDIPSQAVARETMRRAKHNFELIVRRLQSLEYQFFLEQSVEAPAESDLRALAACEEAGLHIPAAARVFCENLFRVSLVGTHPRLCPKGTIAIADPLWMMQPPNFVGEQIATDWRELDEADWEPSGDDEFRFELCASTSSKVQLMDGFTADDWYSMQLPNPAIDAPMMGEPQGKTLVEYLRWSFAWGGFPGWEQQQQDRPEKELALLREGLLPI